MNFLDPRLPGRFWSKVKPCPMSGCWLWTASTGRCGYGSFRLDKKNRKAHRVSYQFLVGEVPSGLQLDHLCRTRCCVNPEHLEAVTARVNVLRGEGQAGKSARATACRNGHEYVAGSYRTNARQQRICLACDRAWSLSKRERGRERDKLQRAKKRAERKAAGVCFQCGAPSPNRELCSTHAEAKRNRRQREMIGVRAIERGLAELVEVVR